VNKKPGHNSRRAPGPAPQTEAWWQLACALRALGGDTAFDDLRDVLWLAQKLPRDDVGRRRGHAIETKAATIAVSTRAAASASTAATLSTGGTPPPGPTNTRRVEMDEEDAPAALYAGSSAGAGTAARRIRLPAPHPLPDALAIGRALLPVTRRRPQGSAVLLDEESTAEAIANTELLAPVLRQRRERWFELVLAVDDAPSMLAWRSPIDAFEALLRRAGFRDVRRVALRGGDAGPAELRSGSGALLSPDGSTRGAATAGQLLLVVSDAASAAWHDGRVSILLSSWAAVLPLALVQTLPPALWQHTAAGFAELQVAAAAPGQVGERLHERRPGWAHGEPGLVLPVLALEASAVASWSRMVMAAGNAWCRAALLPPANDRGAMATTGTTPDDAPKHLLQGFRNTSTPDALELAAAFAVIRPLNLPVMRLIQTVMLPESGADALAQVLISGLLRRTGGDAGRDAAAALPAIGPRDEDIGYEIDDAVRDELAAHLTRSRWLQVNLAVQRFVEIETGVGFDFMAFIDDRLGLEQVAPSAMPFAQLSARMAERFVPGLAGGRRRGRFVDEEVLGKGLTVMARAELPSVAKRIEWSPSGQQVAVLHELGVEVLSARRLERSRRVRHEPDVVAWQVGPSDLALLGPLMERTRDVLEGLVQRPLVNRIEPFGESGAALCLIPLTGAWLRWSNGVPSYHRELLKDLKAQRAQGAVLLPMTPAAKQALALSFDSLLGSWVGVLDRPLASKATKAAIDSLLLPLANATLSSPRLHSLIHTVNWSSDDAAERLVTVRRRRPGKSVVASAYLDEEALYDLRMDRETATVAEFAPQWRAVLWHDGDSAIPDIDAAVPSLVSEIERVARFSPDGHWLAMVDARGEFHISRVAPRETR